MLVGLTGYKQVGKDTVLDYLTKNSDVVSYNFSAPIYQMVETLCGTLPLNCKGEIDKNAIIYPYGVTLRRLLQTLGTEWGREFIHPDIWVMKAQEWLNRLQGTEYLPDYIVFSDVRFNNEAEFIKRNGGRIIRIHRDGHVPDGHKSEEGIHKKYVDGYIYNNSDLNTLHKRIVKVMEGL